MEASLFQQNSEYQRIVGLEHAYDIINSKVEADNGKATIKREKIKVTELESSKKKQKKSHDSSKDINNNECNSSLMETSDETFESVLSRMICGNQKLDVGINEMKSYFDSVEGTWNRLISADEEKSEEISSHSSMSSSTSDIIPLSTKELLSSIAYCGNVTRSNRSLNTPFGTITFRDNIIPNVFSVTLSDKIANESCANGSYCIVIKKLDDISCYKIILISEKDIDCKVSFNLRSKSPQQDRSIDIRKTTYTDAYCEYINNIRIKRIDSLKSFIVMMEGMSSTYLVSIFIMCIMLLLYRFRIFLLLWTCNYEIETCNRI